MTVDRSSDPAPSSPAGSFDGTADPAVAGAAMTCRAILDRLETVIVGKRDTLELVDLVKIYIFEAADLGIDITGHSNIYEEQRSVAACPHTLLYLLTGQNGLR